MPTINHTQLKPLPENIAKQWVGGDEEPTFFKHLRAANERRKAHSVAISCADRYAGLRDGLRMSSAVWASCLVAAGLAFWIWTSTANLLFAVIPIVPAVAFALGIASFYRRHVRDMQVALDDFHAIDAEFKKLDQQAAQSVVPVEPTEAPPFLGETPPEPQPVTLELKA